jgi:hypothetical protein
MTPFAEPQQGLAQSRSVAHDCHTAADCFTATIAPQAGSRLTGAPAPVLAPYLGLVAAVLCALGGGWLLLAPYALDFRHGAAAAPRGVAVDLATGAAVLVVALLTAAFFALALFSRLSGAAEQTTGGSSHAVSQQPEEQERQAEAVSGLAAEADPDPEPDPSEALRDLLTPLVAALAADLRGRDRSGQEQ